MAEAAAATGQELIRLGIPASVKSAHSNVIRSAYAPEVAPDLYREEGRIVTAKSLQQALEIVGKLNESRALSGEQAYRINTAATDLALRALGHAHAAFNDIFARGPESMYYWERLDNDLVIPTLRDSRPVNEKRIYEGCRQVLRIVKVHGEPAAEEWISADDGLAAEYTPTGIVAMVKPFSEHRDGPEVHWFINIKLPESAVLRDWRWLDAHAGCFGLYASYGPSCSDSYGGFRLVRGACPSYEKILQ